MPGKGSAAKALGGGDGGDGFVPLEGNPTSSSGRGEVAAEPSRVVYIGHLPHGFYEKQLLGYFSQFGRLTRVRLSRNKKSGRARGYAFLEFQFPEVARVASEAMDGYFLFKQRLVCRLVPSDKVHPQLFAGARHKFRNVPWRKIERQRHDKQRTPEEHARRVARAMKRDRERQRRIKAAGLEYEYEGLETQLPPQPKKTTFE